MACLTHRCHECGEVWDSNGEEENCCPACGESNYSTKHDEDTRYDRDEEEATEDSEDD